MKGLMKNLLSRKKRGEASATGTADDPPDENKFDDYEDSGTEAEGQYSESDASRPHDFELEPHGLFVLHPTSEVHVEALALEVDLVAVHGLNGTAKKTWKDPASRKFWLEDFLPVSFPKARIMTYGYDSGLAFSSSKAGLESFARDLLNRLRMLRSSPEALILAHEADTFYGDILRATKGIIFMGTPHRGSPLVPWALIFSNLVNVASFGQGMRTSLLRHVDRDADMLGDISRQFTHRATRLKIMSFIEQQVERPLTTLIVPEYSAVLNLSNEMIIPINDHHRGICRFSSADSQNYRLVEAAIKEIICDTATGPDSGVASSGLLQASTRNPREILPTAVAPIPDGILDMSSAFVSDTPKKARHVRHQCLNGQQNSSPVRALSSSPSTSSFSSDASTLAVRMTDIVVRTPKSSMVDTVASPKAAKAVGNDIPPSPRPPEFPFQEVMFNISGLQRKLTAENCGADRTFSLVLRLPARSQFSMLGPSMLKSIPGIKVAHGFRFRGSKSDIASCWRDVFTTPVQVTAGRPCYDPARGLKINHTQKIATFFSKAFPDPLEATLGAVDDRGGSDAAAFEKTSPFSHVASESITLGRKGDPQLVVSFQRTIRIPEDAKSYDLPPGLGRLPLFNLFPFSAKLPPEIVAQGGLFMPLYQFEAMWIDFRSVAQIGAKKFAIRPTSAA
ncbi:hypothetical protein SEUCBS139899_009637 [Sporothrix eucalyptigena]